MLGIFLSIPDALRIIPSPCLFTRAFRVLKLVAGVSSWVWPGPGAEVAGAQAPGHGSAAAAAGGRLPVHSGWPPASDLYIRVRVPGRVGPQYQLLLVTESFPVTVAAAARARAAASLTLSPRGRGGTDCQARDSESDSCGSALRRSPWP